MSKLILPILAVALLCSSCCAHKRACANRYCPPSAPTRPICPAEEASPSCCGKKKATRQSCRRQKRVTLSNLLDYLPGLPPGYLSV